MLKHEISENYKIHVSIFVNVTTRNLMFNVKQKNGRFAKRLCQNGPNFFSWKKAEVENSTLNKTDRY